MSEEKNKKIELSEVDVYFLKPEETKLLWDYENEDPSIWERRSDFYNSVRKSDRYVLAIDVTKPWFYNLFKRKVDNEPQHDIYATTLNLNCNMRQFNDWIKAKYKSQFEEELCLTDIEEVATSLKTDNRNNLERIQFLQSRINTLESEIEELRAKDTVKAQADKKGIQVSGKDSLEDVQQVLFGKRQEKIDPDIDEIDEPFDMVQDEINNKIEDAEPVTNWKAMYFHETGELKKKLEFADSQFKTLLVLMTTREIPAERFLDYLKQ